MIEHATAAGLKEVGAALSKIVAMGAEKGTKYYNMNRGRIGKLFRGTFIPDAHQCPLQNGGKRTLNENSRISKQRVSHSDTTVLPMAQCPKTSSHKGVKVRLYLIAAHPTQGVRDQELCQSHPPSRSKVCCCLLRPRDPFEIPGQ